MSSEVFLDVEFRDGDFGAAGGAGVVGADLDVLGVYAGEILEVVGVRGVGLDGEVGDDEEDVVVVGACAERVTVLNLESDVGAVFGRGDGGAEVVVL